MSWEVKTIGDVCTIEKGNIGITKAVAGEYPLVVLGEERKVHNEYQFDDEAVIIPLVSSTGHGHKSMKRIHYQSGKFSVGNILCAVIPNDKSILSAQYLFRYLDLNKENELVSRMKGMANVSLPMKSIAEVVIPIPPIEKQHEIVARFDALEESNDALFKEHSYQLDLLKKLRQQIFQDAVKGKLVPQDPNDEPATQVLEGIKAEREILIREKKIKKEKPLPPTKAEDVPFEIPENWVWCRLGEIFNFIDYRGKTPTRTKKGVRLISAKNIRFGYIDNIPIEYISEEEYDKWMVRGIPQNGDILFVTEGHTMGFVAQIGLDFKYVLAQRTICFQPYSYCSSLIIFYFLMSPYFQSEVKKNAAGAGVTGIKSAKLKELLIPIPPQQEQDRIIAKVEDLIKLFNEYEHILMQNQKYTQELLQIVFKEILDNHN